MPGHRELCQKYVCMQGSSLYKLCHRLAAWPATMAFKMGKDTCQWIDAMTGTKLTEFAESVSSAVKTAFQPSD